MTETTIGDRIKAARVKVGWSQSRLAKEADIYPSTVSQIESGERQKPAIDVLQKIARALSTTVNQLLGQTEEAELIDLLQDEDIQLFFRNYKNLSPESKKTILKQIKFYKSEED
jgi:transcriptional regulator with XRE-family HTH domain